MTKKILLLGVCLLISAAAARAQTVHAFNSGMNCYGEWRLPDTSTHPYHAGSLIDDSAYQPKASSPSYTNNGNGTVTDNVTGLMWQRQPNGLTYTWENALSSCTGTAAGQMNNGSGFAGYADWRLPNVKELQSIVDYGETGLIAITPSAFPAMAVDRDYWTSTTYAPTGTPAYAISFDNSGGAGGAIGSGLKTATRYIRCVRGGR